MGALLGWFAIVLQFILLILNRTSPAGETILRFLSYFTILTNILVAIYFTTQGFAPGSSLGKYFSNPDKATAITIYITLVGLGYQFLLRHIWNPQGWSLVADELLHSAIPLYAFLFWLFRITKDNLKLSRLFWWSLYPCIYFILILFRGALSGFYPYYFIDVTKLGIHQVVKNSLILLLAFIILSIVFILISRIGNYKNRTEPKQSVQ